MIRKSGYRFSEKIMFKQNIERDDYSKKSHRALGGFGCMLRGKRAPAPNPSRHQHDDDADDPAGHFAAVTAIGEMRRHAERTEKGVELDADRAVEQCMQPRQHRGVSR